MPKTPEKDVLTPLFVSRKLLFCRIWLQQVFDISIICIIPVVWPKNKKARSFA